MLGAVLVAPGTVRADEDPGVSPLAVDPVPGAAWTVGQLSSVSALARDGDTLYLGGSFDYVGPNTGSATLLDAVTGEAVPNAPHLVGGVSVSASDGAGGFYVGGGLTAVGDVRVDGLAHLGADGGFDPSFRPRLGGTGDGVRAMLTVDGVVYVAGDFTSIDGQPRSRLAAFDAATGDLLPWAPSADGVVEGLAASGRLIYLRGEFEAVNGQGRGRLAAVDAATGALTPWAPFGESSEGGRLASAMVGTDDAVYVTGGFWSIGNARRRGLAALDPTTGEALAWDPQYPTVQTAARLAVDDTNVYLGTGEEVVAVPVDDDSRRAWRRYTAYGVEALATDGGRLYVGGNLDLQTGRGLQHVATLEPRTGAILPWQPEAMTPATTFAFGPGTVLVNTRAGGVRRNNLAAIDLRTGRATAWDPDVDAAVETLALAGDTLYAGGYFSKVGGEARRHLAAVDTLSGAVRSWTADTDDIVSSVAVDGDTVYVGGAFSQVAGEPRNRIGAVSTTGQVTSWAPRVDGDVSAIEIGDGEVFIGGLFDSVNGEERSRLASVGVDGAVRPWNPDVTGTAGVTADNLTRKAVVRALLLTGDGVYVGGDFDSVGTQRREGLALVDARTGQPRAWSGWADGVVHALAVSDGLLYAGGRFVTPSWRRGLVAFSADTGAEQHWQPTTLSIDVSALDVQGSFVAAGGSQFIKSTSGLDAALRRDGLGLFDSSLPTATVVPTIAGTGAVGRTVTCSLGTWWGAPTSWRRQWLRDDVPIVDATQAGYLLTPADQGTALRCAVTARNANGPGEAVSAAVDVVAPLPPPPPLAMSLRGVVRFSSKVVVGLVVNRRAQVRLFVDPPRGRTELVASEPMATAGRHTLSWNRRLAGTSAPKGRTYRLIVVATYGGAKVTRTVLVRL